MKVFTKKNLRNIVKYLISLTALTLWINWDIQQATQKYDYNYKPFFSSSEINARTNVSTSVAIIRSDDASLANPSSPTTNPSSQTVEQMVRKAVELMGGFQGKIKTGMTVLIKPNIVELNHPSGDGVHTDIRVIEAIVKLVDEIDHGKIKILVGEGSPVPYTTFEKAAAPGVTPWQQLWGNTDVAKDPGYQRLNTRMLAAGINFRLTNLNGNSDTNPWSELKEVILPNGGLAQPQKGKYNIHEDVLNADVYISAPVMKIHNTGITVALKNQIGIAPSTLYGFWKTKGVVQDSFQHKLLHNAQVPLHWTDKEIVDLSTIAKIKFAIVDAIMCLDIQKSLKTNPSNQVRMNCIVAGEDPVAVDNVCARMMGLNPDDVEHVTLAERMGLGTNDMSKINLVGTALTTVKKNFRKNSSTTSPNEFQKFGQGNREWLLSSSFSTTGISNPIDNEFVPNEASLAPKAGVNGWSQSTYFINDRLDLKTYYNISTESICGYAFTYFDAPKDQEAELWIGSDDPIKVFVNGSLAYNFNSVRTFSNSTLLSQIQKINIKKGLNTLLVKSVQNTGTYDFALNICEVESDPYMTGKRVAGLKFMTDANLAVGIKNESHSIGTNYELMNCYPNPFNSSIQIPFVVRSDEKVSVTIYNMLGQRVKTLFIGQTGSNSMRTVHWDGKDELNSVVVSGTYIVVLKNENKIQQTKKIVFLK